MLNHDQTIDQQLQLYLEIEDTTLINNFSKEETIKELQNPQNYDNMSHSSDSCFEFQVGKFLQNPQNDQSLLNCSASPLPELEIG
jgi:hypothetical protein